MPTILSRVYSTKNDAQKVVEALKSKGVLPRDINVLTLGEGALDAKSDDGAIVKELAVARIFSKQSGAYTQALKKKNTIVVVGAPVGSSYVVRQVFDSHPSIDVGVPNELHVEAGVVAPEVYRSTATAVLLDQRILTRNGISNWTFSKMLGLPFLSGTKKARTTGLINGTITGKMGMPMLTKRNSGRSTMLMDATMSEKFGVPTLIKSRQY